MLGGASIAYANPSQFVTPTQFNDATTTAQFIVSTGNATSTVFDAYGQGTPKAIDSGVMLLNFTASSTSSILGISLQYSNNNVDWFGDTLIATSTVTTINTPYTYSWQNPSTVVTSRAITVPFPTRYTRAVFTMAGANGSVWWQFVPKRQSN